MIKDNEPKYVWKREKERVHKKAEHMDSKQNPMIKGNIPPIYWAILIGDSELSDKYSVTIPSVAVYGRIEPSENVKNIPK